MEFVGLLFAMLLFFPTCVFLIVCASHVAQHYSGKLIEKIKASENE